MSEKFTFYYCLTEKTKTAIAAYAAPEEAKKNV